MVNIFLVIAFCLAIGTISYAQDAQSFCKSYIQCTQTADSLRADCEKLIRIPFPTSANGTAKSVKSVKSAAAIDCGSNVKNISEQLVQKQNEQRQQQRDCLNAHLADAIVVNDKNRLATCQKALDAMSASSNTTTRRRKRKTGAADASANATVSANSTTAPAPASPAGNATVQASVANNATTGTDYAAYAKCVKNSEAKSQACRPLSACCSEVTTCDFEYQLSPLHDQIIQLQYDLFKQYRSCQSQKTKAAAADSGKPK